MKLVKENCKQVSMNQQEKSRNKRGKRKRDLQATCFCHDNKEREREINEQNELVNYCCSNLSFLYFLLN